MNRHAKVLLAAAGQMTYDDSDLVMEIFVSEDGGQKLRFRERGG